MGAWVGGCECDATFTRCLLRQESFASDCVSGIAPAEGTSVFISRFCFVKVDLGTRYSKVADPFAFLISELGTPD